MKQAVPYIRFSTKKQIDSNSYQRQEEAVSRWLDNHSDYVRFSKTYEDLGKSGSKGEHLRKGNGFYKLTKAIEDGHIRRGDVVLVEAWDRATRQRYFEAMDTVRPILEAGVSIVTLDDNSVFTEESFNNTQIFLLVAKIQAAHGYSKQLSERISESYKIRREKAQKGERVKRHVPLWLNPDGTVKEDVAHKVAEAFDLYIAGMGKHAIASRLRLSGVPELAKCSGPTVAGWLENRAVIGEWACSDSTGEPIPGVYEPIIDAEKFYLTQKLLKERATAPRKRSSKHFLVGLVKCHHCGKSMVMHSVGGSPVAMRCLSHHRLKEAGCTNNKSVPINVVKLVQVLTSQKAFKRAQTKLTLNSNEKRILTINSEIEGLSKQIARLVALAMADDMPEVGEQLRKLQEARNTLQAELAQIEAGEKVFADNLKALAEQDTLKISDPVTLNALLKDAGYAITCDIDGNLTTTEDDRHWRYVGVKRKPKSNVTEAYKVVMNEGRANTYIMISPDVNVEVPQPDPSQHEVDLRYERYAQLVISAEDADGEEEHIDVPYVTFSSKKLTP